MGSACTTQPAVTLDPITIPVDADAGTAPPASPDAGPPIPDAAAIEAPDAGPPIPDAAAIEARFAAAWCDQVRRCEPVFFAAYLDFATCLALTPRAPVIELLVDGVRERELSFDPEVIEACLARIASPSCEAPSCGIEDAFRGDVRAGGGCAIHHECAADLFCTALATASCGECAPRLPADSACSSSRECGDGMLCGIGRCLRPLQAGEACLDDDYRQIGYCEEGLGCSGTCSAIAQEGDRCDTDEVCDSAAWLYCASDHHCRRYRFADEGDSCTAEGTYCKPTLSCIGGYCAPHRTIGEPCNSGHCRDSACIDGRCVAFKEAGEGCRHRYQRDHRDVGDCAERLLCLGERGTETCHAPRWPGCD